MCSNILKGSKVIMPYTSGVIISSKEGIFNSRFGIRDTYNARVETLSEKWNNFSRAFIQVDGFWEGNGLFRDDYSTYMKLACLYNLDGFVIITRDSKGTPIEKYHSRAPVVLDSVPDFLNSGRLIEIDYNRLRIAG